MPTWHPTRACPLIVAHRGNSLHAPENTLVAAREALDLGADVIECDVRRSADGQIVLLHDETFARTAGCPRRPEELTLAEIKALDAGSWKHARYAGEPVPTLAELLDLTAGRASLLIDLKQTGLTADIAALVLARGLEERVLLGPWTAEEAAEARRHLPDSAITLIGSAPAQRPADYFRHLLRHGVRGFNFEQHSLTPEFVSQAAARAMSVFAWTVDEADDMRRLVQLGLTGLVTDDPGLLREVLGD